MVISELKKKDLENSLQSKYGIAYVIEKISPKNPIPKKDWNAIKNFNENIRSHYSYDDPTYVYFYNIYKKYTYDQRDVMGFLEGFEDSSYLARPKDKRSANGDRYPKYLIQSVATEPDNFFERGRWNSNYTLHGMQLSRIYGMYSTKYKPFERLFIKQKLDIE